MYYERKKLVPTIVEKRVLRKADSEFVNVSGAQESIPGADSASLYCIAIA
jgi:hypothetical protein